jgi:hypothetical protein
VPDYAETVGSGGPAAGEENPKEDSYIGFVVAFVLLAAALIVLFVYGIYKERERKRRVKITTVVPEGME